MPTVLNMQLERSKSWGRASTVMNYVHRPTTISGLREVFELGQRMDLSVGMRGAGRSYGDASFNGEQLLLDLSAMNRILDWDAEQGVITVEPGVTIAQLWQHVISSGWWPPVVPGTMHATLGGCAGMNIHGKNHWQVGTLGDHILRFSNMLPTGEVIQCNREDNAEMFSACIGAFGMLGCFTDLTLKLKRIHSGVLRVRSSAVTDLEHMLGVIDDCKDDVDYVVGWLDGLASGRRLGRGQVHMATHLPPGEDHMSDKSMDVKSQQLPQRFLGTIPLTSLWRLTKPFANEFGLRLINSGKYWAARRTDGGEFEQSLTEFNFLLDFIPEWEKICLPGGLVQYQSFIVQERAAGTFRALLRRCRTYNVPPMLCVVKRHRPDDFLVSCGVDGFSLAMDFRVTRRNREHLVQLARELDQIVLSAGGRFYLAKDSTLHPEAARSYLGDDTIQQLGALKQRCDPEGILQSNLSRRVLPELHLPNGRNRA